MPKIILNVKEWEQQLLPLLCTESFSTVANIGDSRCYFLNESGFKQVTEDHSLSQ